MQCGVGNYKMASKLRPVFYKSGRQVAAALKNFHPALKEVHSTVSQK